MQVINNENIRPFDVDGTLIVHDYYDLPQWDRITVDDPLGGEGIRVGINNAMVRLMKEEKHRGGFIVVWSRGGKAWAENVIKALKLEDIVDLVMSKPLVYFDDKPVTEWMSDKVFIGAKEIYKGGKR